jgi:hypothetical protein
MKEQGAGRSGGTEAANAEPDPGSVSKARSVVVDLRLSTISAPGEPPPKLEASAGPRERGDIPAALRDRYEIIALLGQGGMGAVYRAKDRQLQRDVALKILSVQEADTGQRVLREARSQARIDHPNVCKVFEAGADRDACHIVMEYIDGAPFGVACTRMTLEEKVWVVAQVARALHAAHWLGLVHRDVKPSNIMVKEGEDGAYTPYLVDFGIAREVDERGRTQTGSLAGTPAFMAPEQARGDIHALDRRTDVYGLGATLFDVLTGRPPFAASSPWGLLASIQNQEAPAVRSLSPEVPQDLEAVVARCLEKLPGGRYESAKALAEDLERFLDGDPVKARRLSPGYVLYRKARKHRGHVALAIAALLGALSIVSLWARERRLSATRASLARELGEDVKEMELFLRGAFELPLHDVEREKDVVRARLGAIRARMTALGPAGEAPGQYALGRGYLALQQPEDARSHLEKASAAGYASPELDYALGLSLGELYTRAMEESKRIDNPDRKKARVAGIEAEYAEPARRHLRASLGARLEAPVYVEGLLALYEGKPEEALDKARVAFAAMPWLYEAKKLEGDARFAIGSRYGPDAAFDYDRMTVEFQAAAEAYAGAAEIARSDPRVHEAECRLWAQVMNAATTHTDSLRPSHDRAKAACDRAIAASSRDDRAHLDLAVVQFSYAWWIAAGEGPIVPGGARGPALATASETSVDPEAAMKDAIALGEDAVRRSPGDPMAFYVMAEAQRSDARYVTDRGLDALREIDGAIASYRQAIDRDGTFIWALNGVAYAWVMKAEVEMSRGLDPAASLEASLAASHRARDLDRSFLGAYAHESIAHMRRAEHLVDARLDPAPAIEPWRAAVLAAKALSPSWPWAAYHGAYQSWFEARYLLDTGRDAGPVLEEATRIAGDALKSAPSDAAINLLAGQIATTTAIDLLRRGHDPTSVLREGRACLQRAGAAAPWDLSARVFLSRVEIVGLLWAARAHHVGADALRVARAPLLPLLDRERVDPRLYQALAEIAAIEADWLLASRKSADVAVRTGLAMAAKALALNPHMDEALEIEARLNADVLRGRGRLERSARGLRP